MKTYYKEPQKNEIMINAECPICNNSKVQDLWLLDSFSFQKCTNCNHIYQNPRPSDGDLHNKYDNDYMEYEVENQDSFLNLMLLGLKDIGFDSLLGEKGSTFLDIGCATGALVEHMKNRGFRSVGLEVCKESAEYGVKNRGIDIRVGTLENVSFPDKFFTHIHSSHVIEHIPEPDKFVDEIYRILKPGGYFICVTPNVNSLQRLLFGKNWRSAIADHVHLFSLKSLSELLQRKGFKILKKKSWGGIPRGKAPNFIKSILDRGIKLTPFGDVGIILGRKD